MIVGRNDPCPCGSGKKFKHCCQAAPPRAAAAVSAGVGAAPDPLKLAALGRDSLSLFAAERHREAIAPLRELVRLQPASAEAHYDLAVALFRCGQFPGAAESLRRALKHRAGFTPALALLAQALEYLGPPAEAAAIHRRLGRASADRRQRLHHTAMAQVLDGELQAAETTLRRLLALQPDDGRTRTVLGQVLIDQHRFEDAAAELREALDTNPAAFQKLTLARRFTPEDRPLLERIGGEETAAGLSEEERALISYGLGKAYDDLGEAEHAIAAYDAANALRRRAARFDQAALTRRYDALIASYDAATLERLVSDAPDAGPKSRAGRPLLIVGLPRSGTTLVEQILSSHPAVTAGGELQFWRQRALVHEPGPGAARDDEAVARTASDYLDLLAQIGPDSARVTDKAPLNFEALGLIFSALRDVRVVHCRRAPIDTALSIYFTEFSSSLGFAFDRADIVHAWREYRRLMVHWRACLPQDRMLEIDYEALVADPEPHIRRLIAFAGLEWDDACLAPERNARVVKTASLWQVRQPIYRTSVERWRRYEPWLGELSALVAETVA